MDAHLAGCAAGKQGRFTDFMHAWWEKGYGAARQTGDASKLGVDNIMKIAGDLGLDTAKLKEDMGSKDCQDAIRADMKMLSQFGVNGTPTFFLNGKYTGFAGVADLKQRIDAEIAAVESSGVPPKDFYQKEVMEKGAKTLQTRGGG